mmetsp:Transcript_26236/g.48927  ORF Transcript_26236/g.48927 Transcript_26236/m.48927 type:complete len:106 (-) Transcript_26236:445-762(-)
MNSAEERGVELFAKLTGNARDSTRKGQCSKCGGDGHLAFQCRNFLQIKTEDKDDISSTSSDSDDAVIAASSMRDIIVSSESESEDSEEERRKKKKKKKKKKKISS